MAIRFFTILIVLLFTVTGYGQSSKKKRAAKKDDLLQQIDSINYYLKIYTSLSPFMENEDKYELINSTQVEITERLLKVLNDKRILDYQIEELFPSDLFFNKSPDNKIYFFSIDQKTGGSYRTHTSIIHYRLNNGTVKAEYISDELTYGSVYLIDSLNQKYFTIAGVTTCNTCYKAYALTLQLDSSSYRTDEIFQFEGRQPDLVSFGYNEATKEFSYEYFSPDSEDSLYGNNAEEGSGERDLQNEINEAGLRYHHRGKFKYLKKHFLEIEKCNILE